MEERRRTTKKKRKTVVKPPKQQKRQQSLSRDEVRSINKKKMYRKRKIRRAFMTLLLTVAVLCVGVVLVFSLFFKINTINIIGKTPYATKTIVEKCGVAIGDNLFRISEDDLAENLSQELPYIKSVTVKRKLPDELIIEVEPATEIACIKNGKTYILLDETGKVLDKKAAKLKSQIPVISNVVAVTTEEGNIIELKNAKRNATLFKLLSAIKESELELLTEIDLKNVNDIKIKYDNRITLKVGSVTNIEKKLARGKKAIDNENEINAYAEGVLDLKTEPYAFFKAGDEEMTTVPTTEKVKEEKTTEKVVTTTTKTD